MTPSSLEKDPAILALLETLRTRLGADAFVVADHWEPDLCSVGVASPHDPRVLVYLSCYREPPGSFSYERELPPLPESKLPYRVAGSGSGLLVDELVQVVRDHLRSASDCARNEDIRPL